MREGSYMEIRPGMEVVGRNGTPIGRVDEVIVDPESEIFVGLAVRPGLLEPRRFVPGDRVERVHESVVVVNAAPEELERYESPEERRHETVEAYEESLR